MTTRQTTAALLLSLLLAAQAAAGRPRPNVLFLFTDDQRADTIAALGNPAIQTPHLDALAASGMVLSNAYCLGANMQAVCTPSRNMLLSGRSYFRWEGPLAPSSAPNLPDSMRAAGYETYHHGKRGNTALEIQKRFEHDKYLQDELARQSGQPGRQIVDEAIDFLDSRDRGRPFFMYLAFASPHDPRVAAAEYLDRYRREEIPLPANFLPRHPFDNGELTVRDEQLAAWPRTPGEIRRHLHEYYAVITALDEQIGRLVDSLKARGEYDDTIIIFSSDHGLAVGSHGLMGKQNLYEHSMKVPLIISGPGVARGRSDALVYLLDIYPTICELAGAEVPPGLDGRSFAGLLGGRPHEARETLFLAYRDVQRAVRDDRWKLIRYPQVDRTQLFDLAEDPHEMHDLSADPAQAGRIERMTGSLRQWQQRLGDELAVVDRPAQGGRAALPDVEQLPRHPDLPDPLVMLDGSRVATAQQWRQQRRPELEQLFAHYMYGYAPPAPDRLQAKLRRSDPQYFGGKATLEEIEITFGRPGAPPMQLLLVIPNQRRGPAPLFLGINFCGNHTVLDDPNIAMSTAWVGNRCAGVVDNQPTDEGRGSQVDVWNIEQSIDRGYAVATFYAGDLDPDRPDFTDGIHPHYFKPGQTEPGRHDWGTIAAWAWGIRRAIDYLVSEPDIDRRKIAVVGHSRLGKTALLAAALDERTALVIPHQAGCGGTAPSRGTVGETVQQINDAFPHWFNDQFTEFNDQVDRLPFDQHCLVAMVAPRSVLFSNAVEDSWANPAGQFEVLKAAHGVYRLLGAEGLTEQTMPQPGRLIDSNLGYYIRPGGHSMTLDDWRIFWDYADKQFGLGNGQ